MVACWGGMSRSSTIVLCYLIQNKNKTAYEAITQVRSKRDIIPSKQQLIYIARLHNNVFGYENINIIDDDVSLDTVRKLAVAEKK